MLDDNKAVVLLSGGLDSTVTLLWARKILGLECRAIFFSYGQRAVDLEWAAVRYFCDKHQVPRVFVPVEIRAIATSAIMFNTDPNKEISNLLEGRNIIFTMMAASFAVTTGCSRIFLGYHKEPDPAPFPDATTDTIKAMQSLINTGFKKKPVISAPFSNMDRTSLVRLGTMMDSDLLDKTHTCYMNKAGGCGKCVHCLQKQVIVSNIHNCKNDPLPENV